MNVIDPDYTVTGMGVCTRGTMNRWLTQAQTFSMSGGWYTNAANPMTVAEYEAALNAWCDSLANPGQGVDAARQELSAAQGAAAQAGGKGERRVAGRRCKAGSVDAAAADVDAAAAGASDAQAAVGESRPRLRPLRVPWLMPAPTWTLPALRLPRRRVS